MDDELKSIVVLIGAITFMVVTSVLALGNATRGSPMQQCIKQGYEWIDENCVDLD